MAKITSWVSKEDGSVVEGDVRCYPQRDGTYEVESTKEYSGLTLGIDKITKSCTVILKVDDTPTMKKFQSVIALGDILIAVNDELVIDETFEDISTIIDTLIQSNCTRRLKFLNPKKCPLQLYLQRMDIESTTHTDLFGFNCTFEYQEYEKEFYASQMERTTQRDIEWVGYLKSIGGPENLKPAGVFKPSADLKAIVRRGIPVAYRASVWQKISLSSLHRSQYPSNYYHILLKRVENNELDMKIMNEIEKDLDRTFPQHIYFSPSGAGETGLRRVLQAFALHNPTIGYCQSLNFLTGMMLIFMQEEDVFWLLITVVERLLPEDYYTKNMVGTYVDQYVLAHIIKKCLPKINSVFEKHNLQLPLITVQWFMCVFVNTLRPEVALRVWDIFLNEGSKVLFRIAAALFQMNETKLLTAKDASDLFGLVRNIGKDVIDADALIALAYRRHSPRPLLSKIHRLPAHLSKNNNNNSNSSNNNVRSKSVDERSKRNINSVSMIREIVNPRLRSTKDSQGAVPPDLIGIGLAHIGPDTCPNTPIPRTEAYSENQAYLEAVGTIGEPSGNRRSSIESRTASSNCPMKFAVGNTLLGRDSASAEAGEAFRLQRKTSTDTDRNSLTGSSERPRSVRQFTPLQVSAEQLSYDAYILQHPEKVPGIRRPGKYKVLNFHRVDIALWRTSYRPSLEEQYRVMDEARQQWKREASSGRYSEMIRRKSDTAASVNTAASGNQQDASMIAKITPEEGAGTSATAAIDTDED